MFTLRNVVKIKNNGTKPVSSVTLTGNYHGRVITDSAKGDIAPGQTVAIDKQYDPSVYYDNDAVCHVTRVVFADGSTWSRSSHP